MLIIGFPLWIVGAALAAAENGAGSDVVRQWVVCQYVKSGCDPYSLAKETLVESYGAGNPNRVRIYAIPCEVPTHRVGDLLPGLGCPEATYPPPAVGLLAVTVGLLPSATAVLWAWFAVNVVALGWVTVGLSRLWEGRPLGTTTPVRRKHLLIAVLVFPPTFHTFVAGQFPLVALALLLAAGDRRLPPWVRGVALGLALVKPSVALPFFLLPVVAREWRVVAWAVAVQVAATLSVVALTGGTVGLFRDWLAVAPFFMQGMYTLQDWLNAVGTQASWLPPAASLASLAACAATLAVARHRPRAQLFSVAAVTSAFWTYHGPYDFVVLLPVLLGWVGLAANRAGGGWSPAGLTLFAALAPATTPAVMGGTGATTRAARWLGRLEVIGLVGAEYWSALRLGVRQSRVKASTSPGLPGLRRRLPS